MIKIFSGMKRMRKSAILAKIIVVALVFALMWVVPVGVAAGKTYGGVDFPLGDISFADHVVEFNQGADTVSPHNNPLTAIGPPDYTDSKTYVALGHEGNLTVGFTDNYLIDVDGPDLYVFEIGTAVEPFKVEISKDGSKWIYLDTVRGQPRSLDIRDKVAPGDKFSYVRITDANSRMSGHPYAGADIDAVGAIGAEEVEGKTPIEEERDRIASQYPGLEKGYLLFSEGTLSKVFGDDYGHVGIYIGDFIADKKYKVRDDAAAPLKVFREGKPTWLYLEDYIKEGDLIIGAVVEMRWEGAVFTTVKGMERHAEETMGRKPKFAWKTTDPPPTPEQVKKIRKFVLSKVALTEKGKLQYDFGEKGSRDFWSGEEEWDCCGLGEAAYEHAGLDPTPNAYEGMCDYLFPQEIYDNIDKPKPKEIRAIAIKVKSPVNLHLYDGAGRHVGVDPQGVVEKEIPNAYYYPKFEEYPQGILITDVKDEYRLVVEALDEGSFNLYLVDRNVCVPSSLTKVEFQEVPITNGTEACLDVGSAGNDYLMSIDENGDGTVDQTLEPTSLGTTPWTPETTQERTLEIVKLFTAKSVYPRGEKVDVHYHIKNTGTVDVDEYYVEYDIIDATGKPVYKNVGGAHSISVGDENKWHSEKWEIPSNAEYGPCTIEARLKWDSETDMETTDFLVTQATRAKDKTAKLEITELYTSKFEYSRGEAIKLCYRIKNVGTTNAEYHLCNIIEVEGEKGDWFIFSTHSIAAGEEQKRCAAGCWKIPSDAKCGTYTIETILVWDSKTVKKETTFIVK